MLVTAEACERNKGPILEVLRQEFARQHRALEIGSGTGQHAVYFATHLPELSWQPTEVAPLLAPLAERVRLEGPPNLMAPMVLNVRDAHWPRVGADAIFSANTLHIMGVDAVEDFFRGVGATLAESGVLCVYGPFNYDGHYTSDSNAQFDAWLKARDPSSAIRDFERVDALARAQGLTLIADHAMPANNRTLVWRRAPRS